MWGHAVHGAANGLGCSENLLHYTRKLPSHGTGSHHPGGADDVVHSDVTVVLDVLHLLPVTGRLLQGLNDQSGRGRDNRHLSLSVLDPELDGDLQPLPVTGSLADVVTNLLGRQTEGTDLGSKGRSPM